MIALLNFRRYAIPLISLPLAGAMLGQVSGTPGFQAAVPTGTLRGEIILPFDPGRPRPFVLAYSRIYGAQVIPVTQHESVARFEAQLRPGSYYVVVDVNGFEPTCNTVQVDARKVVDYYPKLGTPSVIIEDYWPVEVRRIEALPLPSRQVLSPIVIAQPKQ